MWDTKLLCFFSFFRSFLGGGRVPIRRTIVTIVFGSLYSAPPYFREATISTSWHPIVCSGTGAQCMYTVLPVAQSEQASSRVEGLRLT